MLQQVKQIEEFFRNEVHEERMSRSSAPSYDMDSSTDVQETEMLKKQILSLQNELSGEGIVIYMMAVVIDYINVWILLIYVHVIASFLSKSAS